MMRAEARAGRSNTVSKTHGVTDWKAISLWQPWASLIAHGEKKIETRSWCTWYTGPLAIHAAKRMPPEAQEFWGDELASGRIGTHLALPRGCIVGVCRLMRCCATEALAPRLSAKELHYGNYSPGRFAWVLEDIRPVKPIPLRGAMGLFNPPLTLAQIEYLDGVLEAA